jgi:iron complex outermembrane receptor protein
LYYDLYTTWNNASTGDDEFAISQNFINIADSEAEGVDVRIEQGHEVGFGQWGWSLSGTYMIKSENSLYGSNLGHFGKDDDAVSRVVSNFSVYINHDDFSHNMILNYRSGYADQPQTVTLIEDDGSFGDDVSYLGRVDSFVTVDHQSTYVTMDDKLTLTLGVNNLFDRAPPRSLRTSGAGHQLGFDPRYHEPYGRTMYLKASYTF